MTTPYQEVNYFDLVRNLDDAVRTLNKRLEPTIPWPAAHRPGSGGSWHYPCYFEPTGAISLRIDTRDTGVLFRLVAYGSEVIWQEFFAWREPEVIR